MAKYLLHAKVPNVNTTLETIILTVASTKIKQLHGATDRSIVIPRISVQTLSNAEESFERTSSLFGE